MPWMGRVFARAHVRCPYLRNDCTLLGVHIPITYGTYFRKHEKNVLPANTRDYCTYVPRARAVVHTHIVVFGTVGSILVSALGREVQRWLFARLAVCAVGGLRGWRFCAVCGLRDWRFARLAVCAVGGLHDWRFAHLAICVWRLAVCS